MMRRLYVAALRGVRGAARGTGVLAALDRRRHRPGALWLRSLLAIHDAEDMVRLDVPWWTMRATRLVESFLRDRPDARVFEYGSGASTVFLARRAARVHSVEHHAGWSERVAELVAPHANVTARLVEPVRVERPTAYASRKPGHGGLDFEAYVRAIDRVEGTFDLVVIDGRCRDRCLEHAIPRVAPDGMIVFDNAGRARYRAAIAASGLPAIETRGRTYALPYPDCTTLLFRDPVVRDAVAHAP